MKEKVDFTDKFDRKVKHIQIPYLQKKMLQIENARNDTHNNSDKDKDHIDADKEQIAREYEDKIKTIKHAIGVTDLKEIPRKLEDQAQKTESLQHLQTQNEHRLKEMKQKLFKVNETYEEINYASHGNTTNNVVLEHELEVHLESAQIQMVQNKLKFEKTLKLLVQVEHGIRHLARKIEATGGNV